MQFNTIRAEFVSRENKSAQIQFHDNIQASTWVCLCMHVHAQMDTYGC